MKKIFLICSLSFLVWSCNQSSSVEKEIAKIPQNVELIRFDQAFMESENLNELQSEFPYLFPENVPIDYWQNKQTDSLFIELNEEVNKHFSDTKKLESELKSLFQHIKHYYPEQNPEKVITLINEVDVPYRAIYTDSVSFIALDNYLGKDHRFYQVFDQYVRIDFEPEKITVDLADNFLRQHIKQANDRIFLSQIIDAGKILYGMDLLIPGKGDHLKIGYTPEQLDWCKANEKQIWEYFVSKKILYDTDPKLYTRFIQQAPFSKFYLDLDQESPGKVGVYIGWQIVRNYMKKNPVTLQELSVTDYQEIFDKSNYKPTK